MAAKKIGLLGKLIGPDETSPNSETALVLSLLRKPWDAACKRAWIYVDFSKCPANNWRLQGHDYFRIMATSGYEAMQGSTVNQVRIKKFQLGGEGRE